MGPWSCVAEMLPALLLGHFDDPKKTLLVVVDKSDYCVYQKNGL